MPHLLDTEIRRGFDSGPSQEDAAKEINPARFPNYTNPDRLGQITEMAHRDYRGESV